MFAIYVMNQLLICLLLLIKFSAPAFAQNTNAVGGSGGMAEVQKRLAEGSEEQIENLSQQRVHNSEVQKAITQLSQSVDATLVKTAAEREFITPEMAPNELALALNSLDRYVKQSRKTPASMGLVSQLLKDVASPQQMTIGSNPVLAVLQTLAYKSPGKYVQAILSKAQIGDTSTTKVGNRFQAGNTTPELQRLYDTLNGTEKPLTVLKNDREFLLVQPSGVLQLFADDTEYLNQEFQINGRTVPQRVVEDRGYSGILSGTNGAVLLNTEVVLNGSALIERVKLTNATSRRQSIILSDKFSTGFRDIFEIRGWKRAKRGQHLPERISANALILSYRGLDDKTLSTRVMFSKLNATTMGADSASFQLSLAPGQSKELEVTVYASPNDGGALDFATAKRAAENRFADWSRQGATVTSDNPHFNQMLERGLRDIYMLKQSTEGGEAIAAGTPWFAAPFGRDQLVVSLQMLPYRPEIARNVLRLLAAYQGAKDDPTRAEKPGKIMHELRIGEMARMKEIPFTPYYGTVDATPLWVMLLGRYYEQTGDNALVEELRPQLDRALDYLARETAATGYLTYGGKGKEALSNQGWKDSGDSVMYANGRLAQAPIALSEVQGYLYGAWLQAAKLHRKLYGRHSATHLYRRAAELEERFDRDFWLTQKNCYALALDGAGKQVDVVSSNPGHLLMTNLGRTAHLRATADRLMQPDMFSGFGIKTLSSKESRHFNNSYHNGSVWPHDVSIIAGGMHGTCPDKAKIAADSLIAAARYQSGMRLPELYGGYKREQISVPIPYPVACEPQAWAAATPYMLVTAYLGLRADSERNLLVIDRPRLPANTSRLSITNLEVSGKRVNLQFTERSGAVQTQVMANPDKLNISIRQ